MSDLPPRTPRPAPAAQPTGPRRRRDRAWIWALVTFVLLSLCSLALAVEVISGGQLPDLRPEAEWTPPPLQAEGESQPPPGGEGLVAGRRVINANAGPVNLRRTPGYQNKPPDDVIVAVPSGASGALIGGPESADGLTWWRVRFGENEGWMAERSSGGVLLLDFSQ